jgi:hypothetical protein
LADLPVPESYEQLLSDMLSAYAAKVGISDFNVGSAVTSFFEVVALSTARASGDVFQILTDFDVDRATGQALQLLAQENNVIPQVAQIATGYITVTDTSFTKISTNVYAGTIPPNVGSTSINVGNATLFPATGSIYIGRGTPDIEGPIAYASITPTGNYYTINLSAPTTKYHNLGETVILAQGGLRTIPLNTVAQSPGIGSTPAIQYQTTVLSSILDGETVVASVPIAALLPGASGNVPIGSINSFASPPFPSATVTNPLPLSNGADTATDDQLRVQIKNALASQGLGTATAIENAVIGATTTNPVNDTISSANLVNSATGTSATVYIDDGTGYEATSTGVGLESIVNYAIGGEQFFQLATGGTQAPVAKAFLQSTLTSPFDLIGGDTLAITVGETVYQHVFANTDFISPGAATSYEITASVNADSTIGFEATTAGGGTYVVFRAKAEAPDSLQTTLPTTSGRNASVLLGLPAQQIQTLRLYKNNLPLSKDGMDAVVFSQAQSLWSNTIANGDTLILSVDGTAPITYTILNSDFINTGLYTSVSSTNSLISWVEVFNNKLTGITAAVSGDQVSLTSNLGVSDRAQVIISPSSTLVSKAMFSSNLELSSVGHTSDFILDRNTAQFQLAVPLVAGDMLDAGSDQTEANVSSALLTGSTITFAANAHVWFLIDEPGTIINTGVISNTLLSVSTPSTNIIRYTSAVAGAFDNVVVGDYVIVWSAELPTTDQLEGRVHAFTGTTLDIQITAAEWAAVTPVTNVVYNNGFVVLRSNFVPQKFEVAAGAYSLDEIVLALQPQTTNINFSVLNEQFLIAQSSTMNLDGYLLIVTADTDGILMQWPISTSSSSETSQIAFYDSQETEADFPLFVHSTMAGDAYANPIDSYITAIDPTYSFVGREPNELVAFLQPYGSIPDAQPYNEHVQVDSIVSSSVVNITENPDLRRLRLGVSGVSQDRFFIASPLSFGWDDTVVVILDENPVSEAYTIPLYRRAITNQTLSNNSTSFDAYDVDSGASTQFSTYFPGFNFANFKALMRAKNVLAAYSNPANTQLLYRAAQWGRSGQLVTVAYGYPSSANAGITSSVQVGTVVNIVINLASGNTVASSIDYTTQWNVTITANDPISGVDQVTYTWNGVGTNPALSLTSGEYVNIGTNTGFATANTGVYRISSVIPPSSTSFTIQQPHGVAVPQTNVPTMFNGAITFYDASTTTANQVLTYVNANLSQYVTAALATGSTGAGTIVFATYEDSGFTTPYVQLQDGINWIASSNVSGSPQFTFKVPLTLPSVGTYYMFNNGEEVRLIPTTMDQVYNLISILAVTGFTTYGEVGLSDRGNQLELSTQTLGSLGAIQVIGGSGNQYSVAVFGSAERLDNTNMQISANNVASAPMMSGQWFKLEAAEEQVKDTLFGNNTSITTSNNTPIPGQTLVTMLNQTINQPYFGNPRNNVRSQGDTFRIENQGEFACLSWNPNTGSSPMFQAPLFFNDSGGGTVSVTAIVGSADSYQYNIASGVANFTELSINDLITINVTGFGTNNGTFLVTGVSANGAMIQVLNPNGVPQSATAFASGNFSATTGVSEGDTMILSAPFNALNRGQFRVIREFNNSVWYVNPDTVQEEVSLPYNPVSLGFDTTTVFNITTTNNIMHLAYGGSGTVPTLGNAQVGDIVTLTAPFSTANQGSFMVIDSGSNYLDAINPSAVVESGVSGITAPELEDHRPQIQFYPYEATVPGDLLVVTGNVLPLTSQGSYPVFQVLNESQVIVTGLIGNATNVSFNGQQAAIFVQEGVPYSGYKHVLLVSSDPNGANLNSITFDTNAQYEKINQEASVSMTSLNKLNFNTALETGLDSYRYNTGLIAEANRIIYGDPRDPVTYPGVGAAGTDIFVQEPLTLRVQVSLDIRLATGVPFQQTATTVRSNVSGLINSNPVGQSIGISSIISAVTSIPGIISVAISSPLYNVANDLITVAPSEKTRVINPTTDIQVSQIGNS